MYKIQSAKTFLRQSWWVGIVVVVMIAVILLAPSLIAHSKKLTCEKNSTSYNLGCALDGVSISDYISCNKDSDCREPNASGKCNRGYASFPKCISTSYCGKDNKCKVCCDSF